MQLFKFRQQITVFYITATEALFVLKTFYKNTGNISKEVHHSPLYTPKVHLVQAKECLIAAVQLHVCVFMSVYAHVLTSMFTD